jgi:hypothetical protein
LLVLLLWNKVFNGMRWKYYTGWGKIARYFSFSYFCWFPFNEFLFSPLTLTK